MLLLVHKLRLQIESARLFGSTSGIVADAADYDVNLLFEAIQIRWLNLILYFSWEMVSKTKSLHYVALLRRKHHLKSLLMLRHFLIPFTLDGLRRIYWIEYAVGRKALDLTFDGVSPVGDAIEGRVS